VTFSLPDRQVRVFSTLTGKLSRKYDESLAAAQEMQQAGTAVHKLDDMEFGRRLAAEKELDLPGPDGRIPGMWINAVWDESGSFVMYPTLLGIKGGCSLRVLFFSLTLCDSRQHRYQPCSAPAGQGRDCPLDESYLVSRRAVSHQADDGMSLHDTGTNVH
jgi:hypothetical protein